jgi:hypothetical protein
MDRRGFLRASLLIGAAASAGLGALAAWELFAESDSAGRAHGALATTTTEPPATLPATTTVPPVHDVYAGWVEQENGLAGTADWNIGNLGDPHSIEGFFDTVSASVDDIVRLYVSTTAPTYHLEAYRMGWYQGLGGRLIWRSPELPGRVQPPATVDPKTNMVEAPWQDPYPIGIGTEFVPGCYLFKLVASSSAARFVPLTVREDANNSAYLVMNSVTTWQAYNGWGGSSLYLGAGPRGQSFANRSRVVSFERPYEDNGASEFLGVELPVIRLVERLGLDVTYTTNVDIHRNPQLLLNHKALVSLGHDEYYSKAMRDGVEAARDHGVNLAFLGANAVFRQIRFEPSALGADRHEICYKSAAEDPISVTAPELTTVNWRDAPVGRPENRLLGGQYECNPVSADMVITRPDNWVFSDTGLQAGDRLPGVVGGEYDHYSPANGVPNNVEILAHSPLTCQGRSSYADMTYYSASSLAGVFDTGTQAWITHLDPPNQLQHVVDITTNMLTVFGRGPAGLYYPSRP